jgi:LmbE family N-acetylglucosaminyl deacetylase
MDLHGFSQVIADRELVFLSPHFDDVPLIWYGLLAQVRSARPAIRIVNVFSRSVYQARDEVGNREVTTRRLQYATGVRLIEDLDCLDELIGRGGYRYELLAEDECITRRKPLKPGEAFEFPAGSPADFDAEDVRILARLTTFCRGLLATRAVVLLPAAVKEHIDHVILREAALAARRSLGAAMNARLVLGEDQPYMGLATAAEVRGLEATLAELPHAVVDVPVDAQAKCAAIFRHYVSQVEESYRTGVVTRAAQLHGHERLYLLDPTAATRS